MATANLHLTTRTIYGSRMQTCLTLGLQPYTTLPLTTLNEKWSIHNNTGWPSNVQPKVEYYCIGNKGHRVQVGADSIGYFEPIPHKIDDAGLYGFLPFVMRLVTDDLSPTEREKYGLRVPVDVSGTRYYAYYLKRIDMLNVTPQIRKTIITNGVSVVTDFTPDSSNLSPTPPAIPPTGATSTNGEFLSVIATIDLSFSALDVQELINVCRLLYDNELMAAISEIGLVGGVRRTVSLLDSNGAPTPTNYSECLGATIVSHTTAYYPVGMSNDGVNLKVHVGANEPMFGPSDTTVDPEP